MVFFFNRYPSLFHKNIKRSKLFYHHYMGQDINNRFLFLFLLYHDISNQVKQVNELSMVRVRFLFELSNAIIAK